MLLLFALVIALVRGECAECQNCESVPNVCVDKLSAESVCIGGHPVPPGDGNPCVVKDIDSEGNVITAEIPNCCDVDNDCLDLLAPCQMVKCVKKEGRARGQCQVEQIVNCCSVAADCPKLPCKQAICDGTCDDSAAILTHSADSVHKNVYSKRSISFNTTCTTCSYEDIPNCCIESIDCEAAHGGPCKENQQGFCINNKCQCSTICHEECTHLTQDADCAYLQPKLDDCPSPCAEIQCVHGYCKIVINSNTDNDNDTYTCEEDCDDENAAVHAYVWCVDNSQNNDEDAFFKCGSEVTRECGVCPPGKTAINETWIDCDPQRPEGPCVLERECDCCDDSPSQERPDHEICCQADCDEEVGEQILNCGGPPRPVCVTKPAEEMSADDECYEWGRTTPDKGDCDCTGDIDCSECWEAYDGQGLCPTEFCAETSVFASTTRQKRSAAPKKKKRTTDVCDECDGPSTTPTRECLLDCDGDHNPVCPTGTDSVYECCMNLRSHGADVADLSYEFVSDAVKTCCQAIIKESDETTATDPLNLFPSDGNAATFEHTKAFCNYTNTPYIPNQCDCPDELYVDKATLTQDSHQDYCDCTADETTKDYLSICGTDSDGDCTPDCTPIRYCSATNPEEVTQDDICVADGYVPFDALAPCDCAEDDANYDKLHGCFPDNDYDSFLNCTDCVSTCGACPPGTVAVPLPPPIILTLGAGGAKAREPLGRHRHNKRVVPSCTPPPQLEPCPCESEVVQEGKRCSTTPPPLDVDRCDCCDADPYAFPGSRFCSTQPRVCPDEHGQPSFDYNCDNSTDHHVVCEDTDEDDPFDNDDIVHDTADGRDRYIRGCQPANNSADNSVDVFGGSAATSLGECRFNVSSSNCSTSHGYCLERKRNVGDLIALSKRAMGDGKLEMHAPIECDGGTITDAEDYLPDAPPPGSCVEYIQECHQRTHHNITTGCTCDCDICVLVGQ